ncbi:MAG: hypothetical protein WAM53_17125 [Terrimicrobiaceae bacterium]
MWKVVITEIQDASTLDPVHTPPGAFFVTTERFARTVDHLDLPNLIRAINSMQCLPHEQRPEKRTVLSETIPRLETKYLAGLSTLRNTRQ